MQLAAPPPRTVTAPGQQDRAITPGDAPPPPRRSSRAPRWRATLQRWRRCTDPTPRRRVSPPPPHCNCAYPTDPPQLPARSGSRGTCTRPLCRAVAAAALTAAVRGAAAAAGAADRRGVRDGERAAQQVPAAPRRGGQEGGSRGAPAAACAACATAAVQARPALTALVQAFARDTAPKFLSLLESRLEARAPPPRPCVCRACASGEYGRSRWPLEGARFSGRPC